MNDVRKVFRFVRKDDHAEPPAAVYHPPPEPPEDRGQPPPGVSAKPPAQQKPVARPKSRLLKEQPGQNKQPPNTKPVKLKPADWKPDGKQPELKPSKVKPSSPVGADSDIAFDDSESNKNDNRPDDQDGSDLVFSDVPDGSDEDGSALELGSSALVDSDLPSAESAPESELSPSEYGRLAPQPAGKHDRPDQKIHTDFPEMPPDRTHRNGKPPAEQSPDDAESAGPETRSPLVSEQRHREREALRTAKPRQVRKLGGGANESVKVTLDDGTHGVFKPHDGEEEGLRDFVPGNYYKREVAASRVAELLGMDDLVPATVERDVGGRKGSFQRFVDAADLAYAAPSERRFDGDEDLPRAAAFDYLIGNSDRHAANWMVKNGKLVLIDNGLSFPTAYERGNQQLISEAARRYREDPMVLRMVVQQWNDRWPDVRAVLKEMGFDNQEIGYTKERLEELNRPGVSFEDLR